MHAWIFRHRRRLSTVFGMVLGSPDEAPLEECEASRRECAGIARRSESASNKRLGIPPGCIARRERYVVLAPMTPPRD